ncbi:MAG: alpha/beta fold hydrolase [Gammaproteobacteria bacterium]|nr:alpha/beta fold hydrolase [Gammaproteobacteria bacterium]
MLLDTIDIETGANPDAAVIWLHGLGADGHDFEPVVPQLVRGRERAWRFVFPHAPIRPVTLNNGMRMRAWYDIKTLDRRSADDLEGFRDTDARLRELIAREAARGVAPGRIVLGGFSQGGAASLYTAPRLTERLAGVMALSCYLPAAGRLEAERSAANQETPIFMAHGLADNVLHPALGTESRDFLRSLGYRVEWHEYPMAHSVCAEELDAIRAFLLRVLG